MTTTNTQLHPLYATDDSCYAAALAFFADGDAVREAMLALSADEAPHE